MLPNFVVESFLYLFHIWCRLSRRGCNSHCILFIILQSTLVNKIKFSICLTKGQACGEIWLDRGFFWWLWLIWLASLILEGTHFLCMRRQSVPGKTGPGGRLETTQGFVFFVWMTNSDPTIALVFGLVSWKRFFNCGKLPLELLTDKFELEFWL